MKTAIKLALKSIRYRKSTLLLSVFSISLSVVLLLGVERIRSNVHDSFTSTISGTDLIVGARSGNIPLLLATVFHIGYQNQNVSWETYEYISLLKQVDWTIPLSLGDSHKGFDVVGTNPAFFDHFRFGRDQALETHSGEALIEDNYCVIGAKVANELGYQVGDEIVVTHGMGSEDFTKHSDDPFYVAGVLKPTGTPIDQSIIVSLFAMDKVHAHFYKEEADDFDVFAGVADEHADHNHETEPEPITGFLVGMKNPSDILAIQRMVNEYKAEPLTAIMPVVTLLELWEIVRPIERTLIAISLLVLIVALGGILTTVLTSLNERRREMAILRSVGAKPKHIFGLIIFETSGIILAGILTGIVVLYAFLIISKPIIANKLGLVLQLGRFSLNEVLLLTIIFVAGGLIGLIPAYLSYKNAITDGLMVNK